MLLTGVAFKMMVSSWLPKLSYSTILDWYFHVTLLFWMLQVMLAIISSWQELTERRRTDLTIVWSLIGTWCLGHALLALGVRQQWWCPAWEHVEASERDHQYLRFQPPDMSEDDD